VTLRTTPKHLLVAISSHGFGHFAQTASVLNALRQLMPDLRLTLLSTLPRTLIETRLEGEFALAPVALDFGMLMQSALDVRIDETLAAYREFHANWDERVETEAARFRSYSPDLVLANVPYLALAAAKRAGIESAAFCSLNWADITEHYFHSHPDFAPIHAQIQRAYQDASVFLKPAPSMPMEPLPRGRAIGPVARIGVNRGVELRQHLRWSASERVVVVVPGGIPTPIPIETWPRVQGLRWVTTWDSAVSREDIVAHTALKLDFTDLLASCDAVVTKPGYGTIAESVCNGIPVIYARRGDWPEEPFLVDWLLKNGTAVEIDRAQFLNGQFTDELNTLLALPRRPAVVATGTYEAASILLEMMQYRP